MGHRGIWAAAGACLLAGALVAPPGSALTPQQLFGEALPPVTAPSIPQVPTATGAAGPEGPAAEHPEPKPVVPVLIAPPPVEQPVRPVTVSAEQPAKASPPKASAPRTNPAPKPAAPAAPAAPAPAEPAPVNQAPVAKPPSAEPPASQEPATPSYPTIKRPSQRGGNQQVRPDPPSTTSVTNGATNLSARTVNHRSSWTRW